MEIPYQILVKKKEIQKKSRVKKLERAQRICPRNCVHGPDARHMFIVRKGFLPSINPKPTP
jgi:hypothetical protein